MVNVWILKELIILGFSQYFTDDNAGLRQKHSEKVDRLSWNLSFPRVSANLSFSSACQWVSFLLGHLDFLQPPLTDLPRAGRSKLRSRCIDKLLAATLVTDCQRKGELWHTRRRPEQHHDFL